MRFRRENSIQGNVRSELTLGLKWIEEIAHPVLTETLSPIKKHIDDILVPFEQAESVETQLLKKVPQQALDFLVLAWQHDHFFDQSRSKQNHYHQRESQEFLACSEGLLANEFEGLKTWVFEQMDSIIRLSSLVEMVNSVISPYLNSCKGQIPQETLYLIMFYQNHQRYKSGKRKGKAPLELLTGEPLKKKWLELLIQQMHQNGLSIQTGSCDGQDELEPIYAQAA